MIKVRKVKSFKSIEAAQALRLKNWLFSLIIDLLLSTNKVGDKNTDHDNIIYNRDNSKKNKLLWYADSYGRGMSLNLNNIDTTIIKK